MKHLGLNRLRYFLERQFVRGTPYQLLIMVAFVGAISLVGGVLAFGTGAPEENLWESIWWAFLRLTDPGYLGDDEGAWRRIVSTALTVSGYVVFMGALIAIMTQWLGAQMRSLERGLTPVNLTHHIVVLGWTDRTLPLLRELMTAEGRVRRFLSRAGGSGRLRLVILAEDLRPELAEELRTDPLLGKHLNAIILRSGTALNNDHLHRAACLHAAAVIVPAKTYADPGGVPSDVETIKVLLALNGQAASTSVPLPYVVAEIQSPSKMPVARRAYQGPLELVAGNASISCLLVQNVRHPGLSDVYTELLSHGVGQNFYIHRDHALTGESVQRLRRRFPAATLCGVIGEVDGQFVPNLNPSGEVVVAPNEALLLLAPSYESAALTGLDASRDDTAAVTVPAPIEAISRKQILIVGWSRKVPELLREFSTYRRDVYGITILSSRPVEERQRLLQDEGVMAAGSLECEHIVAEVTSESDWQAVNLGVYDSIMLVSSDRMNSGEEADARTIVGYLQLEMLLQKLDHRPQLLLELSDSNNERLLGNRDSEVIISPTLLSHMLVHVALRRELLSVVNELFTAGGAEIGFRTLAQSDLQPGTYTFADLRDHTWRRGGTALGVYFAVTAGDPTRQLRLNPDHQAALTLGLGDEIVVMETWGQ